MCFPVDGNNISSPRTYAEQTTRMHLRLHNVDSGTEMGARTGGVFVGADFLGLMNNSTPWYKTKWRRQGIIHSNRRINDANSIQQGSKAYFLSQVINIEKVTGKYGVALVPSSPPDPSPTSVRSINVVNAHISNPDIAVLFCTME